MVNFGPLPAEIGPVVWGTPVNFHGFRVLAALLHGTPVVGVSQTGALNRGRHLYSAEQPSRWALAHILVVFGSVRQIKLAIRRHSAHGYRLLYRIVSYRTVYNGTFPDERLRAKNARCAEMWSYDT